MYYALNTATGQHEFFTNADAFNAPLSQRRIMIDRKTELLAPAGDMERLKWRSH